MLALVGSLVVYIIAIVIGKRTHSRNAKLGAYMLMLFFAILQTAMYMIDMFNRKVPTP